MSVSNILDANHLIKQEYIPQKLTDKIRALEEFVRVISEAIEIEGYVYNGDYQGVFDNVTPANSGGSSSGSGTNSSGSGSGTTDDTSSVDIQQQVQIDNLIDTVTELADKVQDLENKTQN